MLCRDVYEQRKREKVDPIYSLLRRYRYAVGFDHVEIKNGVKTNGFYVWTRTQNKFFVRWHRVFGTFGYDADFYEEGNWENTLKEIVEEGEKKMWAHRAKRIGIKDCD